MIPASRRATDRQFSATNVILGNSATENLLICSHTLFWGDLHIMTDNNGLKAIYLPQLKAALRSHSPFRMLGRDSGGFHWDFTTAQIIPLPGPTPFPSFNKCSFQEHYPIKLLHCNLHRGMLPKKVNLMAERTQSEKATELQTLVISYGQYFISTQTVITSIQFWH